MHNVGFCLTTSDFGFGSSLGMYNCPSMSSCCCMHWSSTAACMQKHERIAWSLHHKHDNNTDRLSISISCSATALHLAETHLGELVATASACLLSFLSEVLLHQLLP